MPYRRGGIIRSSHYVV